MWKPTAERWGATAVKRLFCLLLAVWWILGGARAETNREGTTENGRSAVAAAFDGGFVTFDEVFQEYRAYLEFSPLFLGGKAIESGARTEELLLSLTERIVREKVLKARLSGAELLSDEEKASVVAEAERAYLDMRNERARYYANETPKKARELADADMAEAGMDFPSLVSVYLSRARSEAAVRFLAGDAKPAEEDVLSLYERRVREDEAYYGTNPEEYVWAADTAAWVPEGYRRARLLLVPFSAEQSALYDDLLIRLCGDVESGAEICARMDGIYRQIAPEADRVSARLEAGEDFDAVLRDYGAAEEFLGEMGGPEGFLVSADLGFIEESLREAVLTLQNPGDVSGRVACDFGYLFAQYLSEVPAGPRPLEEIRGALEEAALDAKRREIYDSTLSAWVGEANPEYFLERVYDDLNALSGKANGYGGNEIDR